MIASNYRVFPHLAWYYRVWNIPLKNYFGSHSHLKGLVVDIDNVIVYHNSREIFPSVHQFFLQIINQKIPYCLSTWNIDRKHTGDIASILPGNPSVIYNDFFGLPFHNPYMKAAVELKIEPSQLLVVDDFFVSLRYYARRFGCTGVKVEPFEEKTEAKDSLILKFLRPIDNVLVRKKITVSIL